MRHCNLQPMGAMQIRLRSYMKLPELIRWAFTPNSCHEAEVAGQQAIHNEASGGLKSNGNLPGGHDHDTIVWEYIILRENERVVITFTRGPALKHKMASWL